MPNHLKTHSPPNWEAHHLAQLKYFRSLSLRSKLEAVEGMADVIRRFQQMRAEGGFKSISKKVNRK